jgi:glutamine amidotransferase
MADIAVIDYGMGNLRSVEQALRHVAGEQTVIVTSHPAEVRAASRVVFPGQGAMPDCIRELDHRELRGAVLEAASSKPFLGICIGLQMLFEHSEEGDVAGLGILPGCVKRFPSGLVNAQGEKLKVPHMGWNEVRQTRPHSLWAGIPEDARFYFVHSYYVQPQDPAIETAYTEYPFRFTSAVGLDNIFAVQFHPEKSQQAGLSLLFNFANWDGRP